MKKFILIILAILIATAVTYSSDNADDVQTMTEKTQKYFSNIQKVEIYSKDVCENANYIQTGVFNIYECNLQNAGMIAKNMDKLLGVAMFMDRQLSADELLKNFNAEIIDSTQDSSLKIIYAYSPLLDNGVEIDNKKVNLQIAVGQNKTVIGSPLIMGAY